MYFVIQTTKDEDGTQAQTVFAFDNLKDAKANYHYFLSSSLGNSKLVYVMASIVNEIGNVVMNESWFAPQPAPEPAPGHEE